jgi:hypothetical protein
MSTRLPGLVHGAMRVELIEVTSRHAKECVNCEKVPEVLRVDVTSGSGRHGTTHSYCAACGRLWLDDRQQEYVAAINACASKVIPMEGLRLNKKEKSIPWPPKRPPK